jgi:hypothetical protein
MRVGREDRPIIELERPVESESGQFLDGIHLSVVAFPGLVWSGIRARAAIAGEGRAAGRAFDLLRVVAERLERSFAARDILDAAVLMHVADRAEAEQLWTLLDDLALWPEWRELAGRAEKRGLLTSPFEGPVDRERRTRAARRRRYANRARIVAKPRRAIVGYAQLRMLQGRAGLLDTAALGPLRRRVKPSTALRYGLPVFGVPLDRDTTARTLVLETGSSSLVAYTPIGAFALTAGDEVAVDD